MIGILASPEDLRRLGGELCRLIIVHRAEIAVIGAALEAGLTDAVEAQPVAELEPGLKAVPASGVQAVHVIDPALHHRVGKGELLPVAVILPQRHGQEGADVAPGAGGIRLVADVRYIVGHGPAQCLLFVHQVLLELVEEGPGIHVIAGCRRKDLRIARPAQALIALGAVGGHVQEIGLESPDRIFVQPVDLRVAGTDAAGPVHVGIQHAAAEHLFPELSGPARHAHIAETEKGKMRPHAALYAVRDIDELRIGLAVVAAVEIALLENLAEVQRDLLAAGQVRVELREACKVLAEVQHGFAGGCQDDLADRQRFLDEDGKTEPIAQMSLAEIFRPLVGRGVGNHLGRLPFLPFRQPAVLGFAEINPGLDDARRAIGKASVRSDDLMGPVGVVQMQLADDGHAVAEVVFGILKAEGTHVPAFSQQEAQLVPALPQGIHGEGHNLNAFFIVGDAGLEVLLPQFFSVDAGFKHTDAAGIQSGSLKPRFHGKLLSHHRMAAVPLFGGDPVGQPGFLHFSGFKPGLCFGAVARVPRDIDADAVGRARFQIQVEALPREVQVGAFALGQDRLRLSGADNPDAAADRLFARRFRHLEGNTDLVQPKAHRLPDAIDFDLRDLHVGSVPSCILLSDLLY